MSWTNEQLDALGSPRVTQSAVTEDDTSWGEHLIDEEYRVAT